MKIVHSGDKPEYGAVSKDALLAQAVMVQHLHITHSHLFRSAPVVVISDTERLDKFNLVTDVCDKPCCQP